MSHLVTFAVMLAVLVPVNLDPAARARARR